MTFYYCRKCQEKLLSWDKKAIQAFITICSIYANSRKPIPLEGVAENKLLCEGLRILEDHGAIISHENDTTILVRPAFFFDIAELQLVDRNESALIFCVEKGHVSIAK